MIGRSLIVVFACVTLVVPCSAQTNSPIDANTAWSLAAVGDVIMNRRLTQFDHPGDPGFYGMAQQLRAADATFMNLEQSIGELVCAEQGTTKGAQRICCVRTFNQ